MKRLHREQCLGLARAIEADQGDAPIPARFAEFGAPRLECRVAELPHGGERVVSGRELHHAPGHFVAAEQMRDAVARDEIDCALRLEGVHQDRRRARRESAEHEIEAEHAAERDRGKRATIRRVEREPARDGARVIRDRALRMHDELRPSGRAGGREQRDGRIGIGPVRDICSGLRKRIEGDRGLSEHFGEHRRAGADHRHVLK